MRVRGVCAPALELPLAWEGPYPARWRAEPRSEPDSGNPTVRDRRGALRNVIHGEPRNPLRHRKSGTGHSSPKDARTQFLSRHPHARFDERVSGSGATKRNEAPALGESCRQQRLPAIYGHRASALLYHEPEILESYCRRTHREVAERPMAMSGGWSCQSGGSPFIRDRSQTRRTTSGIERWGRR